jgi:trehalose-6-phosphatase
VYRSVSELRQNRVRADVLPKLKQLSLLYGVDMEDKLSSVVLHFPHLPAQTQQAIVAAARGWGLSYACEIFYGPESVAVHFLPAEAGIAAMTHVCSLLAVDAGSVSITYASNDAADIPVMAWVLQRGGTVYTVGDAPLIAGARRVPTPRHLAQTITSLCTAPAGTAAGAAA